MPTTHLLACQLLPSYFRTCKQARIFHYHVFASIAQLRLKKCLKMFFFNKTYSKSPSSSLNTFRKHVAEQSSNFVVY